MDYSTTSNKKVIRGTQTIRDVSAELSMANNNIVMAMRLLIIDNYRLNINEIDEAIIHLHNVKKLAME